MALPLLLALLWAPASGLRSRDLPPMEALEVPDDFELTSGEEAESPEIGMPVEGRDGASWEWAISLAVSEAHPLRWASEAPASPAAVAVAAPAAPAERWAQEGEELPALYWDEPAAGRGPRRRWLFGSHHKAGTNLLRSLAWVQANATKMKICASEGFKGFRPKGCYFWDRQDARIWFRTNFTALPMQQSKEWALGFKAVHLIRDPIAMVVSGFNSHKKYVDKPRAVKLMRNMTAVDRAAAEARFVLEQTGPAMLSAYLAAPDTLSVRFESLTQSSDSFDATVRRIYDFTIGDLLGEQRQRGLDKLAELASAQDLRRASGGAGALSLASDSFMRDSISTALEAIPPEMLAQLKSLRAALGYL